MLSLSRASARGRARPCVVGRRGLRERSELLERANDLCDSCELRGARSVPSVPCDSNVEMLDIVLPHTAAFCRSRWLECERESDTLLVAESGVSASLSMGGGLCTLRRERSDRNECSEPIEDCSESVGSGEVAPEPREPCDEELLAAPVVNFDGSFDCRRRTFITRTLR